MSDKQRKALFVSMVIAFVSQAILAVNAIIAIVRDGWSTVGLIEIVPFISIAFALATLLLVFTIRKRDK